MVRDKVRWCVLGCIALALSGTACASKASPNGDETHFQRCASDDECKNLGDSYRCEAELCKAAGDSGEGGGGRGEGGAGGRGEGGAGTTGQGGLAASSGGSSRGGASGSGAAGASGGSASRFCSALEASSGDLDGGAVRALVGDAASSCVLRASDYDRSCAKDTDCSPAGEGNVCETPCGVACASTAINTSALAKYMADYGRTPVAMCTAPLLCGCPVSGVPRCIKGTCELPPPGLFDAGSGPDASNP